MSIENAFPRNLQRLMDREGLTQQALANALEVSNQLVSKWLSGDVKAPRGDKLTLLARQFGLKQPFDIMNEGGVDYLLGGAVAAEAPAMYTTTTRAPLYGRIAAGTPIAMMPVEDELWVRPDVLRDHPHGFYLRVEGDSMNKVLPNGSFAFVDPDEPVENGQIAALNINGGDATVKRVLLGSTSITLVPESFDPKYKDRLYDATDPKDESIKIIGRVVWQMYPYGGGL